MTVGEAPSRHPGAVAFTFGDGKALCEELPALVASGRKTATRGALRDHGDGGGALSVGGRPDVAPRRGGRPALVIETVEVTVRRFRDVGARAALAEGEDDSLGAWRDGRWRDLERNGGRDPGMMPLCERFRPVEVLG